VQVTLGDFGVAVEVREESLVEGQRVAIPPDLPDPAAALRRALDQPSHFPPLRRALTPDDRVAVVVDEQLPNLGPLVEQLLTYLTEAGISPAAITLVSAAGSRQAWVEELPDVLQDVRTEIHDPANRQAVSYLASTRKGRRIYLNRTVVEAELAVVLAGCRYDPAFGCHDGAVALFPALSDAATQRDLSSHFKPAPPDPPGWTVRDEATEVAWLLGVPFLIQIVEGNGSGIAHIVGGTVEATPECERLLRQRWRIQFAERAQTVVALLAGDASGYDFAALARAALAASRVVESGGRIVLLTRARPHLCEAAEMLRDTQNPDVAARCVQEHQPVGQAAALQWLEAVRHASLYLLSRLPDETVEELFATPLQHARQAQRLLDAAGTCLFLDEAHKALAVVGPATATA
jgi:nickel-dependent lactate racemase